MKKSFNSSWRYSNLGENDWKEVTLPHDPMLAEPRAADSAGGTNTGWFAGRDYEYLKEFDAPADAAYIEFEGVYHNAEVWLDGQSVPAHPNGYFGFKVPVTEGKHTIRVVAHNADQPNSRWYSGAGIYRPVTLVTLPKEHILPESVTIRTVDFRARNVSVDFKTTGAGAVRCEILDGDTVMVSKESSGRMEFILAGAELWCPEHPRQLRRNKTRKARALSANLY